MTQLSPISQESEPNYQKLSDAKSEKIFRLRLHFKITIYILFLID